MRSTTLHYVPIGKGGLRAARTQAAKLLSAYDEHETDTSDAPKMVEAAIERWRDEDLVEKRQGAGFKKGHAPKTVEAGRRAIVQYLLPDARRRAEIPGLQGLVHLKLRQLNRQVVIDRIVQPLLDARREDAAKHALKWTSRFGRWLDSQNWTARNPIALRDGQQEDLFEQRQDEDADWSHRAISPAQFEALSRAAENQAELVSADPWQRLRAARAQLWIELSFATGCRPGELRALRWCNVNVADEDGYRWQRDKKTASLEETRLTLPGYSLYVAETAPDDAKCAADFVPPKATSKNSRRVVTLPGHVIALLEQYRAIQRAHIANTPHYRNEGLVFAGRGGQPVIRLTIARQLEVIYQAAALPRYDLYVSRHTHATELVNAGLDLKTVAERLGDKVQTVIEHYLHGKGDQVRAAQIAGEVFGRGRTPEPRLRAVM
jgi:integrase